LEYYAERFHFSYRRPTNFQIDEYSFEIVLLRGERDEWMEDLNLIIAGDISKCSYDEIRIIFKNYVSDTIRMNKGLRGGVTQPSKSTAKLSNMEIGNLLEDMRENISYLALVGSPV
jgi:hypothetical protein